MKNIDASETVRIDRLPRLFLKEIAVVLEKFFTIICNLAILLKTIPGAFILVKKCWKQITSHNPSLTANTSIEWSAHGQTTSFLNGKTIFRKIQSNSELIIQLIPFIYPWKKHIKVLTVGCTRVWFFRMRLI